MTVSGRINIHVGPAFQWRAGGRRVARRDFLHSLSRAPPPHTQSHPVVVWDVHDCRVFFSIMMLAPTGLDWLAGPPIRGQPRVMHAKTHACGFAQQKSILMVGGIHMTDNLFHTYLHTYMAGKMPRVVVSRVPDAKV